MVGCEREPRGFHLSENLLTNRFEMRETPLTKGCFFVTHHPELFQRNKMKSQKIFLGVSLLICLLACVGAIAAWVLGYAHGEPAGWATFGLGILTAMVLAAFTGEENIITRD